MFTFKRSDRVKELMQEEVAGIIREEVKDPRIGFITITKVELSNNLRNAKIFVSPMGSELEQKRTFKGICSAAPFIRSRLGKRMRIKFLPDLQFSWDRSMEHSDRLNQMLHMIEDQEEADVGGSESESVNSEVKTFP
ncbi:MAG: ribosome-binding factor A [bacterium]|nr:MAG: ribosome-binding factor A [bacterium]